MLVLAAVCLALSPVAPAAPPGAAVLAAQRGAALTQATGEIRTRSTVRIQHAGALTLGEVAELTGAAILLADEPVAADLAGLPDAGGGWRVLSPERVRDAVEAALARSTHLNGGGLTISAGEVCVLGPAPAPAVATTARSSSPEAPPEPAAPPVTPIVPGSVAEAALRRVAESFGETPSNIRLRFDPGHEAVLATPADTPGTRVEVLGDGSRRVVSVSQRTGNEPRVLTTINTSVERLASVPVAAESLPRGRTVERAGVATVLRWIDAGLMPAEPGLIIGGRAAERLEAGQVIQAGAVEPPPVIRRGDRLRVHSAGSGLRVSFSVTATEDGGVGEIIEVRRETDRTRRSRETLRARVTGPGAAQLLDAR